ncbi:MAG: hypothetical protein ACK2U4_18150 [Candidatus Promineifilaceae bacterium]
MRTFNLFLRLFLFCLLTSFSAAYAEEPAQVGQALDQAANDPTASLMNVQIQNVYTGDYHNLNGESGNAILLRSAVPFKTGPLNHIARATLPIVTKSPSGERGLSDLVLFDLIVFNQSWGRWGLGPVMLFPTATDDALGAEKWAIGPAVGFVASSRKLLWGVFNQNLFSFAGDDDREDVDVSILQPIVSYSLPNKWSLGTSEMNVTYDWEKSDWTALPLGIKLAKLVKFGKLPVQFSGAYEYNFADDYVAPKWAVNFTVKFLFPL